MRDTEHHHDACKSDYPHTYQACICICHTDEPTTNRPDITLAVNAWNARQRQVEVRTQ